ncbi:MAG: carboxypeptidase regulatory-like domain-containing protein, partial [Abditibacteriota bacterium]|nr:carboxypeptidase regulatory-like domain-containing protein [Abditibacteriota bacterium]
GAEIKNGSTVLATTGSDGKYSFIVERDGSTLALTATAANHADATGSVVLDSAAETLNFVMTAQCVVTGTVTSSFDGRPVAGATVTVGGNTTTTGSDGTYSVTVVRSNTAYNVTASATGYTAFTGTVTAGSAAVTNNITLTERNTLTGTVTSSFDGSAISGATVTVGGATATTDANGVYTIDVDRAASYAMTIAATDYVTATETVTDGGVPTTHNAVLDRAILPVSNMVELQNAEDGAYVLTDFDMVITSATGAFTGDVVYAQSEDRLRGVKLVIDPELAAMTLGNRVRVVGYVSKEAGKTVLTAESVTKNTAGTAPDTLGLAKSNLTNYVLVRTWGSVTRVNGNTFTVYNGNRTFTCIAPEGAAPAVGSIVSVTGIATPDGVLMRGAVDCFRLK